MAQEGGFSKRAKCRVAPVELRFVLTTVRAVPAFSPDGSYGRRVAMCFLTMLKEGTVPIPTAVAEKRFWQFWFCFRFWKNGSEGSGFQFRFGSWVPVSSSGSGVS